MFMIIKVRAEEIIQHDRTYRWFIHFETAIFSRMYVVILSY